MSRVGQSFLNFVWHVSESLAKTQIVGRDSQSFWSVLEKGRGCASLTDLQVRCCWSGEPLWKPLGHNSYYASVPSTNSQIHVASLSPDCSWNVFHLLRQRKQYRRKSVVVEGTQCRRENVSATRIINTWEVIAGQSKGRGVALDQRKDGIFLPWVRNQDLVWMEVPHNREPEERGRTSAMQLLGALPTMQGISLALASLVWSETIPHRTKGKEPKPSSPSELARQANLWLRL